MIQSKRRNTTRHRPRDDVRRIVGSAHADFEDCQAGACLDKGMECEEGEEAEVDGVACEG